MSSDKSGIIQLMGLLNDIGVHSSPPKQLHADNLSAIHIASHPMYHKRTKHIEVDCILFVIFIKKELSLYLSSLKYATDRCFYQDYDQIRTFVPCQQTNVNSTSV